MVTIKLALVFQLVNWGLNIVSVLMKLPKMLILALNQILSLPVLLNSFFLKSHLNVPIAYLSC